MLIDYKTILLHGNTSQMDLKIQYNPYQSAMAISLEMGKQTQITRNPYSDGNAYSSLLATSNGFIVGAEWNFKIRIGFETLAPGYASSGSSGSSVLADSFKLPYRATTAENEAARNAIKNNDWATFLRYKPSGRSDESWRQLYEQYGGQ